MGGGSWCEVLDAGRLEAVSALAYPVYLAYLGKVIKFGKRGAAAGSVSLKSLRLCLPPGFLSVPVRYLNPPPFSCPLLPLPTSSPSHRTGARAVTHSDMPNVMKQTKAHSQGDVHIYYMYNDACRVIHTQGDAHAQWHKTRIQ